MTQLELQKMLDAIWHLPGATIQDLQALIRIIQLFGFRVNVSLDSMEILDDTP